MRIDFKSLSAKVISGIVIGGLVVGGSAPDHGLLADEVAPLESWIAQLEAAFTTLDSVHLRATAVIELVPGPSVAEGLPILGTGAFEYWAQGERFRLSVTTDPRLQLAGNRETAWDGETFYDLASPDGLLRYGRADPRDLPTDSALPNPLFLPLDFLMHEDKASSCSACGLGLSEVASPFFWRARRKGVVDQAVLHQHGSALVATVRPAAGEVSWVIYLEQDTSGRLRSHRVDRSHRNGQPLSRIFLGDFQRYRGPTGDAQFPRHLKVLVFDPSAGVERATPLLQMSMIIEHLEINVPIPDSAFRIDPEKAKAVWNEDTATFEKRN